MAENREMERFPISRQYTITLLSELSLKSDFMLGQVIYMAYAQKRMDERRIGYMDGLEKGC